MIRLLVLCILSALSVCQGFTYTTSRWGRCKATFQQPFCTKHRQVVMSPLHLESYSHSGSANTDLKSDIQKLLPKTRNFLHSSILVYSVVLQPLAAVASEQGEIPALNVIRPGLDLFINVMTFFFICRTVLSWYPKTELNEFPYNIAVWPTEPLLRPVRDLIPPAFGVDVSSLVWIMVLSFMREIFTGQQGILTLLERS